MSSVAATGLALTPWSTTVRAGSVRVWSEVLNDPNPLHFDAGLVRRLGLGERPINQGPANIAFLFNMLATNFPHGSITALEARMTGPVYVGDTVRVTGEVTAVNETTSEQLVHCRLELNADAAEGPAAIATASVVLPKPTGSAA